MRVDELMTKDVVTVPPQALLKDVAEILIENGISGVPVVEDGRLVGVVSEGDIVAKERGPLRYLGRSPSSDRDAEAKLAARTARDAMTTPAVTIEHYRTAAAAAEIMLERGVKRLPVVRDGRIVGIVTRTDLVRAFARDDRELEREIRNQVVAGAFWQDPANLDVRSQGGAVLLAGEVENEAVAAGLPAAVQRVPGVVSVRAKLSWPRNGKP